MFLGEGFLSGKDMEAQGGYVTSQTQVKSMREEELGPEPCPPDP